MRQFLDYIRFSIIGFAIAIILSGPAHALLIEPTFDPTSFGTDPNAAAQEAAIQTAVNTIDGLYSNPGTVQLLFEFNSELGGGSDTDAGYAFVPYSEYTTNLAAISAANPGNTVLATAVANISKGNTGNYVLATTALLRVGQDYTGSGTNPCFNSSGAFVTSANVCDGTFDAVISIGTAVTNNAGPGQNSQAVSEMEHEIDEALGGGGAGSTIGENLSGDLCPHSVTCSLTAIGPTDFYRYASSTTSCANVTSATSYVTSSSNAVCYSIDGGKTALVQMNEAGGGSDYGDFVTPSSGPPNIQDAFYSCCSNQYTTVSPEFTMMESIGYDAVPEPATLALFSGAIGGLGWMRRRRVRPA
jgi:hypothetical protein